MILNDDQHRAMEFIAAVNRGGYRPTAREINEWRLNPDPKPARKGKLLEPAVPGVPERRVQIGGQTALQAIAASAWRGMDTSALASLSNSITSRLFAGVNANPASILSAIDRIGWAGLAGTAEYEIVPGKPGKPAVYGPNKQAEKFLAHLRRLGWIERDVRGRYGLTLLGEALMKSDAMEGSEEEDSSVIVLGSGDQNLGYGEVLGRIADVGDALVVDGYLGTQQLAHLLQHTDASRFLISDKLTSGRVAELALQIGAALPTSTGATRELRKASFHDRYVIGEHKAYALTASLNGLGKSSIAILIELPGALERTARSEVDKLWESGDVVATGITKDDVLQAQRDAAVANREIRNEGGRFMHDGCDVKHRKKSAAENCTNGT